MADDKESVFDFFLFCSSNIKSLICNSLPYLVSLTPTHPDNTAGIRTQRSGFNRHEQNVYFLPILVVDSGPPSLSSTGTLTIRVCGCDTGESYCRSCTITSIIITVTFCISSSTAKKVIYYMPLFWSANSSYQLMFVENKITQGHKSADKRPTTVISAG